jgi:ferredoxin
VLEFAERTSTVRIDTTACGACVSKACVAACETYSRGILRLNDGLPSVEHLTPSEVVRKGTECLACEYACRVHGRGALSIEIPIEGLDAYRAAQGSALRQSTPGAEGVSDGHPD